MQRRPALTRILAAERLCRGPSLEEDARETSSDSEMGRRSSKQKSPGSSRVPSSAGKSSACEERSCGVSGVVDDGPVSAAGVGAVEAARRSARPGSRGPLAVSVAKLLRHGDLIRGVRR